MEIILLVCLGIVGAAILKWMDDNDIGFPGGHAEMSVVSE